MIRNPRWLAYALLLSLALNVLLLVLLFYGVIREGSTPFLYSPPGRLQSRVIERLPSSLEPLATLPFERLVTLLEDERLLCQEEVRVWALSLLVARDHIDISAVLGRDWEPCRGYPLFCLTPEEFDRVSLFLATHRYPFTAEGLVARLEDPGLRDYFCHTESFLLLHSLFARAEVVPDNNQLVQLIVEGGWPRFAVLLEKLRTGGDFSDEARRNLLFDYIEDNVVAAAHLLMQTDPLFVRYQLTAPWQQRLIELAGYVWEELKQ